MSRKNAAMQDYLLISRVAHVIERSGLAMAGAMCGTFVGAQLAKADVAPFEFGRIHRVDDFDRHDCVLCRDRRAAGGDKGGLRTTKGSMPSKC